MFEGIAKRLDEAETWSRLVQPVSSDLSSASPCGPGGHDRARIPSYICESRRDVRPALSARLHPMSHGFSFLASPDTLPALYLRCLLVPLELQGTRTKCTSNSNATGFCRERRSRPRQIDPSVWILLQGHRRCCLQTAPPERMVTRRGT